jgi:hypothetical protein
MRMIAETWLREVRSDHEVSAASYLIALVIAGALDAETVTQGDARTRDTAHRESGTHSPFTACGTDWISFRSSLIPSPNRRAS